MAAPVDPAGDPAFHLYVDTADPVELAQVLPHPLIYGVTTNPTLIRAAGLRPDGLAEFVAGARALGASTVHVQVESADREAIVREGRALAALAPDGAVVTKIPATREGFAAGALLAGEGLGITYTAVYGPEQALFAGILGARYAAPYLGRLTDAGADGLAQIARMQGVLLRYHLTTRLLVASVRSRDDFVALLEIGVGAATVPARLVPELLDHVETLRAERDFLRDAEVQ